MRNPGGKVKKGENMDKQLQSASSVSAIKGSVIQILQNTVSLPVVFRVSVDHSRCLSISFLGNIARGAMYGNRHVLGTPEEHRLEEEVCNQTLSWKYTHEC